MSWHVEAGLHHSRSFDLFAIASSSTDLGSHSMLGYPFSFGSPESVPNHGRTGGKFQQESASQRQLSCTIALFVQSHTLPECLFGLPSSIEIQFYEAESSSHLVEGDVHILERIRDLVEKGRILDARHILSFIPCELSDRVDNWRGILARPKARCEKSATGADLRKDSLWLKNSSDEYKGKWVALNQGSFLGSHESRIELHRLLKQAGKLHEAMFFKVEKE